MPLGSNVLQMRMRVSNSYPRSVLRLFSNRDGTNYREQLSSLMQRFYIVRKATYGRWCAAILCATCLSTVKPFYRSQRRQERVRSFLFLRADV